MFKVFIFFILFSGSAFGAELFEINNSIRALGMGNAYIGVVDNHEALYYNPAGLSKIEGVNWTIFEFKAGANGQEAIDAYNDYSEETEFTDQLNSVMGRSVWLGLGGQTALTTSGFGIALYDNFNLSANLGNPALPNMEIGIINDYGIRTGVSLEAAPGVTAGVAVSRITRMGSLVPVGVETLATLESDDLESEINNRGVGFGLDAGINITAPSPLKPTISLVWKNMGYTSFTKESGSKAPPQILDEMIWGYSMTFSGPAFELKTAVDLKYTNREEIQLGKKLHFGTELSLPIIDLRAGFNQGYYTYGAGVDLGLLQIDAATYGVELGEYPGQHEDRRYIISLAFKLGFDLDFNLNSAKKNRKLKQRR